MKVDENEFVHLIDTELLEFMKQNVMFEDDLTVDALITNLQKIIKIYADQTEQLVGKMELLGVATMIAREYEKDISFKKSGLMYTDGDIETYNKTIDSFSSERSVWSYKKVYRYFGPGIAKKNMGEKAFKYLKEKKHGKYTGWLDTLTFSGVNLGKSLKLPYKKRKDMKYNDLETVDKDSFKHLKVKCVNSALIVNHIDETIKNLCLFKGWKSKGLNPVKRKRIDKKRPHFNDYSSDLSSIEKNDVPVKDINKPKRKGDGIKRMKIKIELFKKMTPEKFERRSKTKNKNPISLSNESSASDNALTTSEEDEALESSSSSDEVLIPNEASIDSEEVYAENSQEAKKYTQARPSPAFYDIPDDHMPDNDNLYDNNQENDNLNNLNNDLNESLNNNSNESLNNNLNESLNNNLNNNLIENFDNEPFPLDEPREPEEDEQTSGSESDISISIPPALETNKSGKMISSNRYFNRIDSGSKTYFKKHLQVDDSNDKNFIPSDPIIEQNEPDNTLIDNDVPDINENTAVPDVNQPTETTDNNILSIPDIDTPDIDKYSWEYLVKDLDFEKYVHFMNKSYMEQFKSPLTFFTFYLTSTNKISMTDGNKALKYLYGRGYTDIDELETRKLHDRVLKLWKENQTGITIKFCPCLQSLYFFEHIDDKSCYAPDPPKKEDICKLGIKDALSFRYESLQTAMVTMYMNGEIRELMLEVKEKAKNSSGFYGTVNQGLAYKESLMKESRMKNTFVFNICIASDYFNCQIKTYKGTKSFAIIFFRLTRVC